MGVMPYDEPEIPVPACKEPDAEVWSLPPYAAYAATGLAAPRLSGLFCGEGLTCDWPVTHAVHVHRDERPDVAPTPLPLSGLLLLLVLICVAIWRWLS